MYDTKSLAYIVKYIKFNRRFLKLLRVCVLFSMSGMIFKDYANVLNVFKISNI